MIEWSSPYSAGVYIGLATAVLGLIWLARRTAISPRLRSWWLFVPRVLVLGLLLAVLLNPVRRKEHRLPDHPAAVIYLVDASRSMSLEEPQSRSLLAQQTIQSVDSQLHQSQTRPQVQMFRFGQQLASATDFSQMRPVDNTTQLSEALEQLPSRFSREVPRAIVVFSDGIVDDGDRLDDAAAGFRNMNVPIHVFPFGSSHLRGDVAIDELVVPPRVDSGVKAAIRGIVRGTGFEGERIVLQVKSSGRPELPALATLPVTLSEQSQNFEMVVEANPEYGELTLEAPPRAGEVTELNNRIPFQLSKVARKLKVLYMEGTGNSEFRWIRDALQEDKDITCVSMVADQQYVQRPRLTRVDDAYRGFPTTREELLEYDCVICSDISIGAFTREQLDWVVELVNQRGGGFVMVGGHTSFGAGGWDQTVWDQLIPVDMSGGVVGNGWTYSQFQVQIPDEVQSHPIWKIVEDPVENKRILAAMPVFLGTNYMQRLKPAATVLGVSATELPNVGIMPIFACQSYGRGRTFAFAPDSTADWGRYFESTWGEGDNRYFRRFWRNVIRWLCENSISGNKRMWLETDRVIYRTGQPVQVIAHVFDEKLQPTINYQVTARFKLPAGSSVTSSMAMIPLSPSSSGKTYVGEMDSLISTALLDANSGAGQSSVLPSQEIEVIAMDQKKEVARAIVKVFVLPDVHELLQPKPRPDILEQLADRSGGTVLRNANDLADLLRRVPTVRGDSVISRQPLWDAPLFWVLILSLLSIEWCLRRLSGYG